MILKDICDILFLGERKMTKKKNTKRIKKENYLSEEQNEAVRFIKILLIIIIGVVIVYFFTRAFVTKDLFNKKTEEKNPVAGEIDYSMTLIGNMLNKPEDEYYVIIYSSEDTLANYYNNLVTRYNKNKKPLAVYTADLANELNKNFVSSEASNLNAKDINDFRVKDLALLKIKKGKIVKTFDTEEKIVKELKYEKDATN